MTSPALSQSLGGRARGIAMGALIALGWAAFALSGTPLVIRYPGLAAAIALSLALVVMGIAIARRARNLPQPDQTQRTAGRRTWLWFWLNFAGEVVLLNIAIRLLSAPHLRIYWIPAISAVVGLHFWPMAHFFRVRSYWWVGAAMMVAAALTALLLAYGRYDSFALIHGEALVNAIILWSALGAGAVVARRVG